MVFYLLSIFISLLLHSFCECDISIGNRVSISVPSTYRSGFEGRAYFIRAGEVVPSFKAALSIEALDGRYLCALVVLFGEMEVWNSRRFSLFFPLELCVLELMESGVLQLRDSSGRVGWRTGTSGQGVEISIMPSPSSMRWLSLVGTIWLQSISATNTDFPAYSSQLKHILSISQVQLNNLAFASDAGKLFGWISGIAAVYLPLWLVLLIGTALGLVGYGVQFLFLVNKIAALQYWHIFLLTVLAGNSICWINTVCYVITIRNFPFDRKIAVGISNSYVGLSAKIYTAMVDAFYHGAPSTNSRAYLLLNSVVPMGVSIVTAPLMRDPKTGGSTYMVGGFVVMFFVTIVTGVYAVMGTVGPLSKLVPPRVHAVGLGILLAAPLAIPVSAMVVDFVKGRFQIKREMRVHSFSMEEDGVGERVANEAKEEGVLEIEVVGVEEQMGVRMMVRRVEFWLYFFVYMFGATLGLVFLNNLGQIAESRGLSKSSSLVSLSSSFGFFGRLMPSLMDYFLAKSRYAVSSTACIATLMAPMTGAFFMLLNTTTISLYISTAVIGVCTGAITSIAVSTTSELFGTKNFSVNHNIIVANIPIGSFLFGYFAAILYQKEGDDRNGRCMGADCYRKTFLIWGSICSLGTLLSFILYLRIRKTQLERG